MSVSSYRARRTTSMQSGAWHVLVTAGYAIERSCTHRREQAQADFARKAMEVLPSDEATSYEPSPRGLVIAAETELSLERPVRRLRDVYGDMVRIGPPRVRYRKSDRIEQPIIGLRVLCAHEHYEPIRSDLRLRRGVIVDTEVTRTFGIIRACAPMTMLLGYPDALKEMSQGRAHLVMWLSHYEQLDDPPPLDAA